MQIILLSFISSPPALMFVCFSATKNAQAHLDLRMFLLLDSFKYTPQL